MNKKTEIEIIKHKIDRFSNLPFSIKSMQEIEKGREDSKKEIPHIHDFYTIIWIEKVEGGNHIIDFNEFHLSNNTIYFLSPGQVHMLNPIKPSGWVITFTESFSCTNGMGIDFINSLNLFQPTGCNGPINVMAISSLLNQFIELIIKETEVDSDYKGSMLTSLLKTFLIYVSREKKYSSSSEAIMYSEHVSSFIDLVNIHFLTMHKVVDYATKLNLSPGYLNDIVKQETARSAKSWITDRIILEAKRMAHFTDLSSKEIAYKLGFDDPSYFSKFFSTHTKIGFIEFRNQIRKNHN